jgi:hypothetical protein
LNGLGACELLRVTGTESSTADNVAIKIVMKRHCIATSVSPSLKKMF